MKRREFVLLRYSVFFTLLYILVGCTENRVQMQRLQVIDSLMEAHPMIVCAVLIHWRYRNTLKYVK